MNDGGYNGGSTVEGRWGCIAAALVTVPAFMFLLLIDAMGDCAPDMECEKGFLTRVLLPSAVIAICVWLLIRWAIKTHRRSND